MTEILICDNCENEINGKPYTFGNILTICEDCWNEYYDHDLIPLEDF